VCAFAVSAACAAEPLPIEPAAVESLGSPSAHWVWVNDIAFFSQPDGKALLVDGDSGRMLGMLSTGFSFTSVLLPKEPGVIYSPETYYSRGTRGTRTDVVTLYDSHRLQPLGEVEIPPKRASVIPMRSAAVLTDDDRFLLIYNFTPAQSVSVVDTHTRAFVGEIETAGCALIYPTGPRTFFSICTDGALLVTTLGDDGKVASRVRSAQLFDGMKDPLSEKAVRAGDSWLFASLEGTIYPIHSSAKGVKLDEKWPLFTAAERAQGWRTGGLQHLALHRDSGRLFALVHRGGPETHKDAGGDIWVYSVAERKQVQQIAAHNKAMSIQVSQDARPLLFACSLESNRLDVYDATSGAYLRTVDNLGQTPSIMVTP
jgi:methylamine dehydrogenase heavy chain